MSNIVLYIATSLDGFIARPDGKLDWLTSFPYPEEGDYGYAELLNSIGTIIMGRKTYDEMMGFGIDWPYSGFDTYVATKKDTLKIQSPDTYLLAGNLKDRIPEIKMKAVKDIWLVGGGELVTAFINDGLLDRMIITILPKIIGEGIPLFASKPVESNWTLVKAESFETGAVNLTYDKNG